VGLAPLAERRLTALAENSRYVFFWKLAPRNGGKRYQRLAIMKVTPSSALAKARTHIGEMHLI